MKTAPKHKRDKEELSFYKSVTPIVGDYIVKDVFRWLLSDKIKKVAVIHFSRSTTEYMRTYIKLPT